jgi:acetoin utilization deacetylase AcuC-like enzyme
MSLILIHTESFAEHVTPPGHPERPERADVMGAVASRWRERGTEVVAPRAATEEQLTRVHAPAYVRMIANTAGRATALDPDTYTSPESYDVALLAAGAAVDAVERVLDDAATSAFALVRPPGHHAERSRAMGFCLFNNVAVAAAHARTRGASRVAIVDFDVHHGNGTQHIFERDPNVLYISTHQFPYYPGTGAADEAGEEDGHGFTVNLPLEVGAVDDDYAEVFGEVVVPVLEQFKPELLLVSAGFDAHERDPLAGMRLTTPAFAAMTGQLRAVADAACAGRMVLVTEGGYDLQALTASLDAVIETMCAEGGAWQPVWPKSGVQSSRGLECVEAVRAAHDGIWKI